MDANPSYSFQLFCWQPVVQLAHVISDCVDFSFARPLFLCILQLPVPFLSVFYYCYVTRTTLAQTKDVAKGPYVLKSPDSDLLAGHLGIICIAWAGVLPGLKRWTQP